MITHSTTLTADVGPCPEDGLIVRASDITLDLGGHTVRGARTQTAAGNASGIRLAARSGVTVRNGTVTGFDAGVVINKGSANTLTGLVVRENVSSANPDLVHPPEFTAELGDGIVVFDSAGNHIERNVVRANGIYDNIGVLGAGSDENTIAGNEVGAARGSSMPAAQPGTGVGIILNPVIDVPSAPDAALYRNRVLGNVVRGSADAGISVVGNVDAVIRDNVVENNGFAVPFDGDGIRLPDTNALVSHNTFKNNADYGVASFDARANRIVENAVVHNGHVDSSVGSGLSGGGIYTWDKDSVRGNVVRENLGHGVFGGGRTDISVVENRIVANARDGIVFGAQDTQGVHVLRNEVHGNDGSGIVFVESFYAGYQRNEIRANDAAGNALHPEHGIASSFASEAPVPAAADLYDLNFDDFVNALNTGIWDVGRFGCGGDVWFGNAWGSGGYFPKCVTAGGSGPPNTLAPTPTQAQTRPQRPAAMTQALQGPEPPAAAPTRRHLPG